MSQTARASTSGQLAGGRCGARTGRAIEHASHVYRASRYSFELTLVEK